MYIKEGKSQDAMASHFGVSRCFMHGELARRKIKCRNLKQAGKLRYSRIGFELSQQQRQLLFGSLLGDACLFRQLKKGKSGNTHVTFKLHFAHGEAQLDYLRHKQQVLPCSKIGKRPEGSNLGKPVYQTAFSNSVLLSGLAHLFHDSKHKKRISQGWLDAVDWEGLAYWYQDDGSLIYYKNTESWSVVFYTNGFSLKECNMLKEMLLRFGLRGNLNQTYKDSGQYKICCHGVDQIFPFLERIKKFIVPCLHYKLRCLPSFAGAVTPS